MAGSPELPAALGRHRDVQDQGKRLDLLRRQTGQGQHGDVAGGARMAHGGIEKGHQAQERQQPEGHSQWCG